MTANADLGTVYFTGRYYNPFRPLTAHCRVCVWHCSGDLASVRASAAAHALSHTDGKAAP